ncbi:hypothetical protein HK101_007318 [Irineochytrium annulatum]|nr:hypothetical protein HK101_007318 [Irineochytrium annulatum]
MIFTSVITITSAAFALLVAAPANGARVPLNKNAYEPSHTPSRYDPKPTMTYYETEPSYEPKRVSSHSLKPSYSPSMVAPPKIATTPAYAPAPTPSIYVPEDPYTPAPSGGYAYTDDASLICPHTIPSQPHGCRLFVRGFDITGVTTEVDLTIADGIMTECDCLARCSASSAQCVSWVWKFTDNSGHRTCTLYSNYNLPSAVTIAYDVKNSTDIMKLQPANNPQAGSTIPQCTIDGQPGSKPDPDCFSGSPLTAGPGARSTSAVKPASFTFSFSVISSAKPVLTSASPVMKDAPAPALTSLHAQKPICMITTSAPPATAVPQAGATHPVATVRMWLHRILFVLSLLLLRYGALSHCAFASLACVFAHPENLAWKWWKRMMDTGDITAWRRPSDYWTVEATGVFRCWAPSKSRGASNVPRDGRKLMFIGNHQLYAMDVPIDFSQIYMDTGIYPRGMADRAHFLIPLWKHALEFLGGVEGSRENCRRLMEQGAPILVYPGGAEEVFRGKNENPYALKWKRRSGFAKMAADHGYTIVPFASVGTSDMFQTIFDIPSKYLFALLGDFRYFRTTSPTSDPLKPPKENRFPIIAPWSLTPQCNYMSFGAPIDASAYNGSDEDAVWELREKTRVAVEGLIGETLKWREGDTGRFEVDVRGRLWNWLNGQEEREGKKAE